MMRDRKENSITHLKNQVGTYFMILGNKIPMSQYERTAQSDASPSPLECAYMVFVEKYIQTIKNKIDKKKQNLIRLK